MRQQKQKTIRKAREYSGIGIHTGSDVRIRFCPAAANTGIVFQRVDLPAKPLIPALISHVFDTSRSTNLEACDAKVYTVEHVLAAVRAFEIDNLIIELTACEPPAGNGSSDVFVEMLAACGEQEQEADVFFATVQKPVFYSEKDIHLVALPSDEYRISYTLHYPHAKMLGSQYFSVSLNKESFIKEIAPCRTFALYDEVSTLIDRGLIRGASLDNAVVIKDEAILSKGGLFFPDEPVRHKVLDLIGDLSLIGIRFTGHIIAIRSGHTANFRFAEKLYSQLSLENS
jgi:UDP-3-O-[3-hydroxymyristoyl] N-acetylglucosamine deacetylase